MTQEIWEVTPPPAKPEIRVATKAIVVLATAILILGGLNIYSGLHPSHPAPSSLALQQIEPDPPVPASPRTFEEARDGSKVLFPEDMNGSASIWHDTTSGARIFCLDSCIVLPRPRHHRRHL